MTIQTTLAPRFWVRKLLLTLTFITLGSIFTFAALPTPDPLLRTIIASLCFIAVVIFLFTWLQAARQKYALLENGSLETPEGCINQNQMRSLQVLTWDHRRLAKLEYQATPIKAGPRNSPVISIKLDGWIHHRMDDIINTLNERMNPPSPAAPVPSTIPEDETDTKDDPTATS